jgi:hypothetical protein
MSDNPHESMPPPAEPQAGEARSRWWSAAADILAGLVEIVIAAGAAIVRGILAIFAGILDIIS